MPSYLDFETTKNFRNFILGKTLTVPNGPQTFTAVDYSIQTTRNMSNVDSGTVDSNRQQDLLQPQTSNVYKPTEYFINENLNTIPRKANLSLYPYFERGQTHGLISILSQKHYDTESELMNFAASYISTDRNGPFFARLEQNLYRSTVGRVRLLDALDGNTSTAINIITGREPIIEKNNKITVAKTILGKGVDFAQTIAGVEFPWAEIPGDYLSNPKNPVIARPTSTLQAGAVLRDITGALGSLVGINRRPTTTKKPSDLFIDYMGTGPKSVLFDNLTYSKYAPNYTHSAMSQNTSKVFNFIDNVGSGIRSILGLEAPRGVAYIGDDRGDDVKFAMNDFNDRPVKSSYYLSLLFDPIQTQLFQRKKNIGEGGGIGGKLTWISTNSKNKLGINNAEFSDESSQYLDTLSTNFTFREDSILGLTQEILDTLPTEGGAARSHVANVIDQTSRIFREGDVMISRGSAIKYVNSFTKQESGAEFCRVWTKDRSYMNYSDTMKRTTLSRKFESSILSTPWNLNIYPNSNGNGGFDGSTNMAKGKGDGFYAKKYMFSIENLAWKTSNTPGFTYNDLPYCERGPNGGRVMWFPPYDLKVNEQNSAKWEENTFLGRPEPVYTYQNTTRGGQVSFKVIVDHPSILNLLVKDHFKNMSDEESDNYINAFFAGCEDVDFYGLIRKYTTLTPTDVQSIKAYLNGNKDPETIKRYKTVIDPVEDRSTPKNEPTNVSFKTELYFKNDFPQNNGQDLYTGVRYSTLYNEYISYEPTYISRLNTGLNTLTGATWGDLQRNDYKVLTGLPLKQTKPSSTEFDAMKTKANNEIVDGFSQLQTAYGTYSDNLTALKTGLSTSTIKDVTIHVGSRTSSIADDNYNVKLAYRRSYSIITDMLDKLAGPSGNSSAITDVIWKEKVSSTDKEKFETTPIVIPLKHLGYDNLDGNFTIEYVANIGEQPIGTAQSGIKNVDCTENSKILTSSDLKQTAPITFWCRESIVDVSYTTKAVDTPTTTAPVPTTHLVEVTDTPTGTQPSPPIDELKKIIMKTLSECYYFKKLEEESPVQFSSLREKLRYFHPAFHSMTPEGLNARLTFLNQCVRPGDTIPIKGISESSDLNARNTTFGPPPILVMRIGDFYHSKIIVRDVNITFDEGVWDLNPEGIGVQPMIANVTLQVNFIGGHGLETPVAKLQNALTSNFYANTEVYDPRSTATEDRSKFTKSFLEDLVKNNDNKINSNTTSQVVPTNKITQGTYIGSRTNNTLNYTALVDELFDTTSKYFSKFIEGYNITISDYGYKLSSMLISPTYRTIKNYTVQTGAGTETITFLGEYRKGNELEVLSSDFKSQILDKIETENISTLFGFNKDMSDPILVESERRLKPYVSSTIGTIIDGIGKNCMIDVATNRNRVITVLDKLNFIIDKSHDGKITDNLYTQANFTGYTYDALYNTYNNVISYIKDNGNAFTENLDESYIFSRNTTMSSNDLSLFLSELLRTKKEEILKIYRKDPIFTAKILKDIEKRLDKFLAKTPEDNKFKAISKKYPARKDKNTISFNIDTEATITDTVEQTMLTNTLRTSGNKTTSILNYFR